MSRSRHPEIEVELLGQDGNAMVILSRVRRALIRAGHQDGAKQFMAEAMAGDYDRLLQTAMEYVEIV